MKEVDRELIRECPDGTRIYNYNPPEEVEDTADLNEGITPVQWEKGLTFDTAKRAAEQRPAKLRERVMYRVYIPCCRCTNCVILRKMGNGELLNRAYVCKTLKMTVEKFGTCNGATWAKSGPLTIAVDAFVEEAKSKKMELVN